MKIIDCDKLFAEFKPNGYVSEDAHTIANMLIYDLCIQSGSNLACFLEIKPCYDNHMAMRIWVQRRLDTSLEYVIEDMCNQLQSELYDLLSPSGYGY